MEMNGSSFGGGGWGVGGWLGGGRWADVVLWNLKELCHAILESF